MHQRDRESEILLRSLYTRAPPAGVPAFLQVQVQWSTVSRQAQEIEDWAGADTSAALPPFGTCNSTGSSISGQAQES